MTEAMWERLPDGRLRVKEAATRYIDIVPMIYNWRIVTTYKDRDCYDRGWCYAGRDPVTAILAAMAWDPDTEDEPQGWIKQAAPPTGRRRPDGDASQEYVAL
jgi:hypothetical protein